MALHEVFGVLPGLVLAASMAVERLPMDAKEHAQSPAARASPCRAASRMGEYGHMDPKETITKGIWRLRDGWITLRRSDDKKIPFPYDYTHPDGTGWALAIPMPTEEKGSKPRLKGSKPRFLAFFRREQGQAVFEVIRLSSKLLTKA